MSDAIYDSLRWRRSRAAARARDRDACVVARLLGGDCSSVLHVHHLKTPDERPDLAFEINNLVTVCEKHHPELEAFRRFVARKTAWKKCPHKHVTGEARRQCEERLNAEAV